MNATMKARIERSAINLIKMSTKLVDDTRMRLIVPLKPATATMAEMLVAKGMQYA